MRHKNRKVETKFMVATLKVEVAHGPLSPMISDNDGKVGQGLVEVKNRVNFRKHLAFYQTCRI